MYQTWIPIHGRTLSAENREVYLAQLRKADCRNIVIVAFEMAREGAYEALADHIAFFRRNGVEAGIWIGTTIGHGIGLLTPEDTSLSGTPHFQPLVNLNGETCLGTRCPLDKSFRSEFSAYVAELAKTGARTILLDDDFRLSRRSGGGLFCACDRHLSEISRLYGEPVSRELLREQAFSGKPNKLRDAWLRAQGDSLRLLAKDIRAAVDAVDPSVRVALCGAHSLWDVDGADGGELAEILAGEQPPLLRLHGAPYWAVISSDKDLTAVFEIARMFASFHSGGKTTLLAEGDVYPRPRFNVPASFLELFDAAMRTDGHHDGILKYMVDYCASVSHETGYLAEHSYDLPDLKAVSALFDGGANLGVRVHVAPHRVGGADLSLDPPCDQTPYPSAGTMLQAAGIPTVYSGEGFCDAVFGEEGQYIDPALCKNGMILDAVSAIYLTRRGIDVGLDGEGQLLSGIATALITRSPAEYNNLLNGRGRFLAAPLKAGAIPLTYAVLDGKEQPLVYRYENADGQRFLVCLFSGLSLHRSSGIFKSYLHGACLRDGIEWLSKKPLPVRIPNSPNLYSLAARNRSSLSLLLLNCFEDRVLSPVIRLDRAYGAARFVGCSGTLDGHRILLDAPLPAYSFAAVEVSEPR